MGEVSKADWSWINQAADQFERAWKAGSRPRIEDFLARATDGRRGPLLDELLRVECEIRRRQGEKPTAEEYRHRFPEHHAVVDAVFALDSFDPSGRAEPHRPERHQTWRRWNHAPAGTIPAELAEHPDYEIIRELGRGGMGVVYLAHNEIMGRDEVLKVIGRDVIERPGVLDRFLREMRTVASLQHPNIVTAYSAFRAGGNLVFAMEYVDGLDLAKRVKAKGPMPVGHACYFVHQAALGLQHAHEAGMVHRDIKPGNLMLTYAEGKAGDQGARLRAGQGGVRAKGARPWSRPGRTTSLMDSGLRTHDGSIVGHARLHCARADHRRARRRHPSGHL